MSRGFAYYNDFEPAACEWMRELMRDGLIAPGYVDNRSIADVQPDDLREFRQCHFFAGIGLWSLTFRLAGIGDDEEAWSGSCPCQPFSAAGKQLGRADERHLWPEFFRLIQACRPKRVFGEQVASAAVVGAAGKRAAKGDQPVWVDGIHLDLKGARYALWAADLPAACVGSPNIRQRLWWCAYDLGVADAGHERSRRTTGAGEAKGGRPLGDASGCGADGWLANPQHAERRSIGGPEQDVGHRDDAGRTQAHGVTGACGEVLRLANPDGGQSWHGELQSGGQHGQQPQDGGAGGVEHAIDSRLEGHAWHEPDRSESGWIGAEPPGPAAEAGGACSAWSDFDLILCTDGKARRVPAKSQPVLLGVADAGVALHGAVDPSGDASLRVDEASKGYPLALKVPHRTHLLRGFGNSINAYVAATFVKASLSVISQIDRDINEK